MYMEDIASWDELFKPENGFVNNDTITLEIRIKTDKPEDEDGNELPIAKRAKLNERNKKKASTMECPICFKRSQDIACTPCGHLFCFVCIENAVTGRAVCPTCNKAVRLNTLRRLCLSVVN